MSIDDRLASMKVQIPTLPSPAATYVPAVVAGNLIFASGQTPTIDGQLVTRGKVGTEVSVEDAQRAARLAALNCLAEVKGLLGSLDSVAQIVFVTGYVASSVGFADQPTVVNGASQLLEEVFGARGRHARVAVGVAELPGGAPVEVALVASVVDGAPARSR